MTPNLLARTVETVEGGGIVVLLLQSVDSLKQLYTMSMVSKFHLRFLLPLLEMNEKDFLPNLNFLLVTCH